MCVTNTASRRPQPVSFNSPLSQSVLSQRLLAGGFPAAALPPRPQVFNQQLQLSTEFIQNAPQEKPKPKRRRKPQKPGKTAKNNDRHFVVHNYHDHAHDLEDQEPDEDPNQRRRGGVSIAFPLKLHAVLDQVETDGLAHVISWQPHGRCFVIHKPKEFVDHVMPKYFRQTKLTSFQRQLNLYGFCRLTRGKDGGGYYHELFLRGKTFLCKKMIRTKVKGTKFKAASSPDAEPDFYTMPPVVVSPHHSDEELSHGSAHQYVMMSKPPVAPAYLDPLPVQYSGMQQAEIPVMVHHYYGQAPTVASQPYSSSSNYLSVPSDADRILDEAVDELFIHRGNNTADENLVEFVNDWDPNVEQHRQQQQQQHQQQQYSYGPSVEDDSQLGYMLEKLLED